MGHCAPCMFRCLLFQLMHHFFHRQQEGPRSPSAQTTLSTWVTYHSNLNSLFSENKLLESNFFCCCFSFLFFFLHVIQSLMKSRLLSGWHRNIHCWVITTMTLHHLKKNSCTTTFQTSSFLYQRWQTLIVQIPNLIHCQGKKVSS